MDLKKFLRLVVVMGLAVISTPAVILYFPNMHEQIRTYPVTIIYNDRIRSG
jgi:heme oxygenase